MSEEYSNGYARGYEAGQESMLKLAEQPAQQEPVACVIDGDLYFHHEIDWEDLAYQGHGVELLYTTPPAQPAPTQEHQINQLEKFKNHVLANADALGVVLDAHAAPVQEPCQYAVDVAMPEHRCVGKCQYAAQRTWVGLTDEEKAELDAKYGDDTLAHLDAVEAKLKEKNT